MTMIASPPPDRRIAHANGSHENGAAQERPQEIKYRQDAANYIAAMLAELRQIAGKAGFDKLVKSLDGAYYDAYGVLDGRAPEALGEAPPQGREKISKTMEPNHG